MTWLIVTRIVQNTKCTYGEDN